MEKANAISRKHPQPYPALDAYSIAAVVTSIAENTEYKNSIEKY